MKQVSDITGRMSRLKSTGAGLGAPNSAAEAGAVTHDSESNQMRKLFTDIGTAFDPEAGRAIHGKPAAPEQRRRGEGPT